MFDSRTDAIKLRLLADWFDYRDSVTGHSGQTVQADLRRIADYLEVMSEPTQEIHYPGVTVPISETATQEIYEQYPYD